jgi:hypothetical protein
VQERHLALPGKELDVQPGVHEAEGV